MNWDGVRDRHVCLNIWHGNEHIQKKECAKKSLVKWRKEIQRRKGWERDKG